MDLNFDSTQIVSEEIPSDFGALPEGKYLVHIAETEEKISNSGNKYLNLKLQVLEGEYKNRYLWDIVNLWHPKDNVREIAQQTMKTICNATNVLKPQTSEELHYIPLRASVSLETDSQYGDQNRVKKYLPANAPVGDAKKQIDRILDLPKRGGEPPASTEAVSDDIPF
jgi:hypothetical protein